MFEKGEEKILAEGVTEAKTEILSEFGIFGDLPVAHPARSLREEVGRA